MSKAILTTSYSILSRVDIPRIIDPIATSHLASPLFTKVRSLASIIQHVADTGGQLGIWWNLLIY